MNLPLSISKVRIAAIIIFFAGASNATAKILTVGNSQFKTIQSAVDAASAGDVIRVQSGIYEECLTLKDGVSLEGQDANSVIIQADFRQAPVLKIENCKNVHIAKITLKQIYPNQLEETADGRWAIINIHNSAASLANLIVRDGASQGIKISNGPANLDFVSVVGGNIYNNRSAGITVEGNGNVELKNNTCNNNKKSGICLKGDADGKLIGNLCTNNTFGIAIIENAVAEAVSNKCFANKSNGIWYESKSPFTASDNTCLDNGTTGIEISSQVRVSVAGNNCRGNSINGIYLRNGVSGAVRENTCSENKWHGISVDQYSRPHVDENKCFNNKKCGIYTDDGMLGQNQTYDNGEFHWQEVHMYLRSENFDQLEKMASLIRKEKRRFDNGNWQLEHFYYAFSVGFEASGLDENVALLNKWISKYPASIAPRIGLAKAIYTQAWNIRGRGYASNVAPSAWDPFKEHLSKAMKVIKEAQKLDANDPAFYATWITAARGLGNREDIELAYNKGIAIEPTYYPLHNEYCFSYRPRWFGSEVKYEKLAQKAADLTKPEMGQSVYFLLAKNLATITDVNEFKEMKFDYARLKQGQKDFVKQFPAAANDEFNNHACLIACAAGNKEDARDYFLDIEDNWCAGVWKDLETFKKYKAWARNKDNTQP